MNLTIELTAPESTGVELESLREDLLIDDALRGATIESRTSLPAGGMGPITETLLVAFTTGGAGVAVVEGVFGWLRGRPSGITVRISNGDRTVEVDAKSARDPRQIIELLRELDLTEPKSREK
ncbi:effector-associated constant component EACC1 [Microbispora catharanthi]|uniref:Uncharacterized protein n=1 Tax=Microbispora catharanthi TaxID=1712871 RepID=A0A5N6BSG2_9ACTN|nr:hypothetical protein [Microbispora catharanthi]KAB8183398.1 hypothetical protein FH610_020045 [Microbispora catharanthi]